MSLYEDYIAVSRYARYLPDQQRRETWEETVDRYVQFFGGRFGLSPSVSSEIRDAIVRKEVMPSMRCLMTAGDALERDNICGYNCAYVAVDHIRVFGESLYIQMNGTGLGFSVERQYVQKLPEVAETFHGSDTTIVVSDSKLGWATALDEYVRLLYSGKVPKVDTSRVRPSGAPLKTFGGRASGPWPFERMLINLTKIWQGAKGRKLTSIELHDAMCHIGECVVVGGVRRTSLISLSNHSDERMRHAKMGNWFTENPQRSLSNNSICYTEKPDMGAFLREWLAIYESRSGERGIFNRQACKDMLPERRDPDYDFGCNPCSEIVLRGHTKTGAGGGQFCNLTEVVAKPEDDMESLKDKVRLAAILGTMQSSLTDFKFLRKGWKDNCEEERLLGVSITGIYDCPFLLKSKPEELRQLKEEAIAVNQKWAEILGINPSAAVTCVKPSGTVSQLCDSGSGIHPRWANQYIRRVRNDKKDPISWAMMEAGVPHEEDKHNPEAWVFSFPMKSPRKSLTRHEVGPIQQLELWKHFALNWCEHKPSMTCYMPDQSWPEVASWIWGNWDIVNGISFLPSADEGHIYDQAPYEDCTIEEWKEMAKGMPKEIDWKSVRETVDVTTASQELACVGDNCEI
jgi:ribonucleoside-diphosphate reductase alpha chain